MTDCHRLVNQLQNAAYNHGLLDAKSWSDKKHADAYDKSEKLKCATLAELMHQQAEIERLTAALRELVESTEAEAEATVNECEAVFMAAAIRASDANKAARRLLEECAAAIRARKP